MGQVLEQHGLHEQPGEPEEERRHYSTLCRRFHRHQVAARTIANILHHDGQQLP